MAWEDTWIWYLAVMSGLLVWGWSILQILTTRYSPAGTSAWLLLIVFMPFAGVPLYAVFGGRKLRKVMRQKRRIQLRRSTVVDVELHRLDRSPAARTGRAWRHLRQRLQPAAGRRCRLEGPG